MKKITYFFIMLLMVSSDFSSSLFASENNLTGNGTESSPYSVTEAIANQGGLKWVEGYIVGNVDGTGMSISTESKFSSPFTITTNILIAVSASENDYTKCLPVQLPAGAVRDGLNLVQNVANLGKKVKLYGSLEAYFTVPGLKSTTFFELEGGVTGGTKPADTSDAIFSESFAASSQGQFTIENVLKPAEISYVWTPTATYGMKASAYVSGTNYATESWLISPSINLTGTSSATLSFEHTGRYFSNMNTEATVWVSENYISGSPVSATWTQVNIPVYMTGTNWTFVNSGNLNLTPFVGKNIKFAFKYTSSSTAAATWEVKNVIVKGSTTGFNNSKLGSNHFYVVTGKLYSSSIETGNKIDIFNIAGSKVKTLYFENGINISEGLNKGIYFIRSGNYTQKIIL